jgi:hypothetical protein
MSRAMVRLKEPGCLCGAASQPSGSKLPRHRVDVFAIEMPEHCEPKQNFHLRYHFSTQAHGFPSS